MSHSLDWLLFKRKNFQTAFKLAQSVGIQQTLSINELLNNERPDWNAVMNYVAFIYRHFQQQSESPQTGFKLSSNPGIPPKVSRSSSSSPTSLRNLTSAVQNALPLSLSASTTSTTSSTSSAFNSASSSSSSISKTIN